MRKTKSYRMESILEERIVMGDYTLLDFPAERKLAAAFNVTQMTARKAVKNLERRGLLRRLPNGSLKPVALPVWKWEAFYIEIIRSIFDGTWGSSGARAINYWWGMRSGAEEINYQKGLPGGTLHLLDMMEMLLSQEELRIFPDELYDQNHQPHSPASVVYSPKELMEMDWLDECVEGALPHYDDLDVKTRTLMAINGLDNLKGLEK